MVVTANVIRDDTTRITGADDFVIINATLLFEVLFHDFGCHKKELVVAQHIIILNIFFSNALTKKAAVYFALYALAANAVPEVEDGNTIKFRLKDFFTHLHNVDAGLFHNAASGRGDIKFRLITKSLYIIFCCCFITHPYGCNLPMMAYNIFKHPFRVACIAASGIKNP